MFRTSVSLEMLRAIQEAVRLVSTSQKKRKRSTGFSDGDGCKRCNCKKTKCLKLYCDCFAAGCYCARTCSCEGCFNSPEYEDTVLDTRRQIVSRNPLAFAPKILQRVGESPASNTQDINKSTPSSVRHKRGCSCKKSMCLKRYCECYQQYDKMGTWSLQPNEYTFTRWELGACWIQHLQDQKKSDKELKFGATFNAFVM